MYTQFHFQNIENTHNKKIISNGIDDFQSNVKALPPQILHVKIVTKSSVCSGCIHQYIIASYNTTYESPAAKVRLAKTKWRCVTILYNITTI